MPASPEIEFKLQAAGPIEVARIDAELRDGGIEVARSGSTRHVDTYLDTACGALAAAGMGLRLRQNGGGANLCLKGRAVRDGAQFVRSQIEVPWSSAELPASAAELPDAIALIVEPFVVRLPLRPVLQLQVQREVRVLHIGGRAAGELAIDNVAARADTRSGGFQEVEIEVIDDRAGCERLAGRLMQRLHLQAAQVDKPTRAAALLGLLPEPERITPEPAPDATTGPFVAARVRRRWHLLQEAERDFRASLAAADLHRMRTELRRLRTVIRTFAALWPDAEAERLQTGLRDFARRLGLVRELDVLLDTVADAGHGLPAGLANGVAPVVAELARRREQACGELLAWLRSAARLQTLQELRGSALATPPGDSAAMPLATAVQDCIAGAAVRVRRHARAIAGDLPAGPIHRLRIACKRLANLHDEFAAVAGAAAVVPPDALAAAGRLQRRIGRLRDREAAAQALLQMLGPGSDGGAQVPDAVVGALVVICTQDARTARKPVRNWLARVRRKKLWRAAPPPEAPAAGS